jgi:hypothetical protein
MIREVGLLSGRCYLQGSDERKMAPSPYTCHSATAVFKASPTTNTEYHIGLTGPAIEVAARTQPWGSVANVRTFDGRIAYASYHDRGPLTIRLKGCRLSPPS